LTYAVSPALVVNPSAPNLQATVSGNTLSLARPTNAGWTLLTNSVSLAATNQWFPYPNSANLTNVNSRARLWLNGNLDVTATETSSAVPNYSSNLRLGNTHGGAANWFKGRLDDVRFYRRALSQSEVSALIGGNQTPNVALGSIPPITNGVAATLTGSATDDGTNGPLTAGWSQVSGPGVALFGSSNNPVTIVTFNQPGSYVLQLSASNAIAEVFDTATVNVSPNPNLYADWVALAFPGQTNSAIVGPTADPDGDGVQNLIEFALGINPALADARPFAPGQPGLPVGAITNVNGTNYLTLKFQRPSGRLWILYAVEASGYLTAWAAAVQLGAPVPNGDGTETLTFRDTMPVVDATHRFLRLKITAP
jgi:hypothetical protein